MVRFIDWTEDIIVGTKDKNGIQLRPHIVWFGEDVPLIDKAISICKTADILLIIGTSLQVYPAANLMHYVPQNTPAFYIDPNPNIRSTHSLKVIPKTATNGIKDFITMVK